MTVAAWAGHELMTVFAQAIFAAHVRVPGESGKYVGACGEGVNDGAGIRFLSNPGLTAVPNQPHALGKGGQVEGHMMENDNGSGKIKLRGQPLDLLIVEVSGVAAICRAVLHIECDESNPASIE